MVSKRFLWRPMVGASVLESIRPWGGASLGYDYYSRFSERSEFKNMHVGFDLQGGIDTEGDGFVGIGVRIGVGFGNESRPFGSD